MDKNTRTLLFFLVCIPLRALMGYISFLTKSDPSYSFANFSFAFLYLIFGVQMIRLWLMNERLDAIEGGGTTWWNHLRPIHGSLFILFAYMTVSRSKLLRENAYLTLFSDVLLALTAWFANNYTNTTFTNLN